MQILCKKGYIEKPNTDNFLIIKINNYKINQNLFTMKTKFTFTTIIFLFGSIFLFSQNCVDFESLTVGTEYGDGYNTIGEVIFTENDIPVSVEYFEWNTGGTFNIATVENAFAGFGTGKIMNTNNINLGFDFTNLPYNVHEVIIKYADVGGHENLSVNGEPMYVGELTAAPNFPGVLVNVTQVPISGGHRGLVILTGNIESLVIGGQEFWLDDICTFEAVAECIEFENLTLGDQFGDGINTVGEVIYMEDDVPVSVEYFDWPSGGTFGTATVDFSFDGFGFGKIMGLNNINLGFDFTQLGFPVHEVTFEFADLGGFENLSVNGSPMYVGELKLAPDPPGVVLTVTTSPMPGGEKGLATLEGNIERLVTGGQEFWLDNVCFYDKTGVNESYPDSPFFLGQNFPNPVINTTEIPITINRASNIRLNVYNLLGQEICELADELYKPGIYFIKWDGTDKNGNIVPDGIYLYKIQTENNSDLKKMLVVR